MSKQKRRGLKEKKSLGKLILNVVPESNTETSNKKKRGIRERKQCNLFDLTVRVH